MKRALRLALSLLLARSAVADVGPPAYFFSIPIGRGQSQAPLVLTYMFPSGSSSEGRGGRGAGSRGLPRTGAEKAEQSASFLDADFRGFAALDAREVAREARNEYVAQLDRFERSYATDVLDKMPETSGDFSALGGKVQTGTTGDPEEDAYSSDPSALVTPGLVTKDGLIQILNAQGMRLSTGSTPGESRVADVLERVRTAEWTRYQRQYLNGVEARRSMADETTRASAASAARAAKAMGDVEATLKVRIEFNAPVATFDLRDQPLKSLYRDLESMQPASPQGQRARDIGLKCLREADDANAVGDQEAYAFYKNVAVRMADIALGVVPVVGEAQMLYELIAGKSLLTGERLSTTERVLTAAGLVTLGAAPALPKLGKWVGRVVTEHRVAGAIVRRGQRLLANIRRGGTGLTDPVRDSLARALFRYAEDFRVTRVLSAEEANDLFLRRRMYPGQSWGEALRMERPWQAYGHVVRASTKRPETFVRFSATATAEEARAVGRSGPMGAWVVRAGELEKLKASGRTSEQIAEIMQRRYALKEPPAFVTDVHVGADSELLIGPVGAQFGGREGALQYHLETALPEDSFKNTRTLKEWLDGK